MSYLTDAETHERLPKAIKKRCKRECKFTLIEETNPDLNDLLES